MSKQSKINPTTLSVGSRVIHATNKKLTEGVIVWKHADIDVIGSKNIKGKDWSVHWTSGDRGIYRSEEINKIPPKKIKDIVKKEVEEIAVTTVEETDEE